MLMASPVFLARMILYSFVPSVSVSPSPHLPWGQFLGDLASSVPIPPQPSRTDPGRPQNTVHQPKILRSDIYVHLRT